MVTDVSVALGVQTATLRQVFLAQLCLWFAVLRCVVVCARRWGLDRRGDMCSAHVYVVDKHNTTHHNTPYPQHATHHNHNTP